MSRHLIDCRGLLCPMPVIRVQSVIESLQDGTQVEAVCSDPGALNDIPAWCRVNGHRLIETRSQDGEYIVVVEVDHGSN